MKPVERVLSALCLEESDRVPIGELEYHPSKRYEIVGSKRIDLFVERLDLDIVPVELKYPKAETDRTTKRLNKDTWIDGWGIKWQRKNGLEWYKGPGLEDIHEIDDLVPPDPDSALTYSAKLLIKRFKGKRALAGRVDGPKTPYLARGISGYIKDLYQNYELAKKFMDISTTYDIEVGKRLIEIGVDFIVITGDVAYRDGPLVSMKHFKDVFVPSIRKCVNAFHKMNVPVVKHTDGNLTHIFPDLLSTGIDGVQSFEPEAGNRIDDFKIKYGEEICIWGNVDLSYTLTLGTKRDVFQKVRDLISVAAPGGGFILSSSNNLNSYCKAKNYLALVQAGKKYGKY